MQKKDAISKETETALKKRNYAAIFAILFMFVIFKADYDSADEKEKAIRRIKKRFPCDI